MDLKCCVLIVLAGAVSLLSGCQQTLSEDASLKHFARGQVLAYEGDLDAALDELTAAI